MRHLPGSADWVGFLGYIMCSSGRQLASSFLEFFSVGCPEDNLKLYVVLGNSAMSTRSGPADGGLPSQEIFKKIN